MAERGTARADATGKLAATPLTDMLISLLEKRMTGSLVVQDPTGKKSAFSILNGVVVKAKTADPVVRLGDLFVELHGLEPHVVERALRHSKQAGVPMGQSLLRLGAVEESTLEAVLAEQLGRRIEWTCGLPSDSRYGFYGKVDFLSRWGAGPVHTDPLALIWRCAREHANPARVESVLTRLGPRQVQLHPRACLDRFLFGWAEFAALERLKCELTPVREILATPGVDRDALRRMVYVLALTRHLDLGDGHLPAGVHRADSARTTRKRSGITASSPPSSAVPSNGPQSRLGPATISPPAPSTIPGSSVRRQTTRTQPSRPDPSQGAAQDRRPAPRVSSPQSSPSAAEAEPPERQPSPPRSPRPRPPGSQSPSSVTAASAVSPPPTTHPPIAQPPASRPPISRPHNPRPLSRPSHPRPASSRAPASAHPSSGTPSSMQSSALRSAGSTPLSVVAPTNGRPDPLEWRLNAKVAQCERNDLYGLLEIDRGAAASTVQGAFVKQAKVWHPDKLPPGMQHRREDATRVFARLSEARRILSNPELRERYEYQQQAGETAAQTVSRVVEAANAFRKAELLARRNDYVTALRHAEAAYKGDNEQHEYAALYAYVVIQSAPNLDSERLEDLVDIVDAAAKGDKDNVRIRLYRGFVLKRAGREHEAIRDFKFVARSDRHNVDALREIRLYNLRREREEKSTGLFSGLFSGNSTPKSRR